MLRRYKVDMKQRFLLLLATSTLLALVFVAHVALKDLSSRRPQPVQKNVVEYPTFAESCYDYVNFTAENVCCKMKKYIASDVLQCVKRFNGRGSNSIYQANSTDLPAVTHIALVGDSHMRNMFVSIAQCAGGNKLQYRIKSEKNTWREAEKILHMMRTKRLKNTVEMRHVSTPFRVTWYRDWKLDGFPELIHRWETNQELRPSLVITGGGLHWMKTNPPRTGAPFRTFLVSLAPYLRRLAAAVPVYFKLIDYVPRAYTQVNKYPNFNPRAISLYNSIARQKLQATGVVIWDSTLRLSVAYSEECTRSNRVTPGSHDWNCVDNGHIGYIMLEQYTDMIYNAFCNRFLNLTDDYCDT
ncbi:uncharacterized protein LOC125040826 isoform X2 [Penaeus chinensis]|uniref:uncharacterized protein LOC125040826 isoform X2 n=1 Tax=Penaeus chinensis TaxID=139456 RepID=UPI001FB5D4EB|nr:uncharacterized protein LOC125040826 isoform X2 [Penaeus chinensis]